jgi:Rha family phage regulatory protein
VNIEKNSASTTSNIIAEHFGKTHKHVLDSIDNLIRDLTAENYAVKDYFKESDWINDRNRKYRMYKISRDGFSLLGMGFTGKKALKFKTDFIKAFKLMESRLKESAHNRSVGVEVRKVLTDTIEDSGENKRMHGHGFSTYTKLAYKLAGIKYIKPPKGIKFRDQLNTFDLDRVKSIESIMKELINSGKIYNEIKEDLNNIFGQKLLS